MRTPFASNKGALLLLAGLMAACSDGEPPLVPSFDTDAVATSAHAAPPASPAVQTETADIFGQGPDGPVVAEGGATLRRTPNGISVSVSMPTPAPGSYLYPDPSPTATDEVGPPEAFTLWVFVFNDPEAEDWDGAFLGAGHVVGGPNLKLTGHVSTQTEPFAGARLDDPQGAEVHVAVAPHGALDADRMPAQIQTPSGPGPDIWWLAVFD
jgi:hypothetical protein